jgi:hypothetical protein
METTCAMQNQFDGHLGLRVSAIFVILVGGLFGGDIDAGVYQKTCR